MWSYSNVVMLSFGADVIIWCYHVMLSSGMITPPYFIFPENFTHLENPIYVFLFWELRSLSPNFHIHVSVSDLYIPRIGPHISLQQNRQTDLGNI
jgi:hypothetical protein